ncbi:hypothetical protein [Methylobacterium sp. R2-1]|uniref:hypothetical protein n=1 Tax=Methylobacterium sp. R2-1 TaxID=2587064 RepID=UPI0016086791|nr:hypothetical protein [Methylobacterium sp. R2-1]MBB2963348.1 hypothetical protein [Methylobacterium sp. R2-1]
MGVAPLAAGARLRDRGVPARCPAAAPGRLAEECLDGLRYCALGNAYPRPVLAWVGRRIAAANIPLFTVAAE